MRTMIIPAEEWHVLKTLLMGIAITAAGRAEAASCYGDRVAYGLMSPECEYLPLRAPSESGSAAEKEGSTLEGGTETPPEPGKSEEITEFGVGTTSAG
jgi:hypothetical protein